ncbi:MAG: type VI secretion lipoprotein TssJ [Gammaproteobacteria bacterium]|nr:type VI secretion lipoprotein TssJ [Gammaproteobacteria bacterium]
MTRNFALIVSMLFSINVFAMVDSVVEDGIRIELNSSKDANLFDNLSHTTVLVLYQFKTLDSLKRLTNEMNGMEILLKGESFNDDVLMVRKEIIPPGVNRSFYWDRHKSAKYVAAVAGYFISEMQRKVKVFTLKTRKKHSFFWKPKNPERADTVVHIQLGRRAIE